MNYDSFPKDIQGEWDRFQKAHGNMAPGKDFYMPIFDNGILFPLQRTAEMAAMIFAARALNPQVVMEIGSDKGGGFFHWCKSLPTVRRAIACEFRGVPFMDAFLKMFPLIDFCFVEGSSYDVRNIEQVKRFLKDNTVEDKPDMLDCLFIDGDKNGTAKDFAAYAPLVRPGGLVFIHDIEDRSIHPSQFFYSLAATHRIMGLIDGREGLEAEAREKAGQKCETAYEGWLRIWKWTSCGVGIVQM